MARLGYARYVAQGGDWGAMVTTAVGLQDAQHCAGIHLNMPIAPPGPGDARRPHASASRARSPACSTTRSGTRATRSSRARARRPSATAWSIRRPGQAAWILEKFWAWTDCDGHPENVLTRDELLDNVMLYWLPATAASSARLYWESFRQPSFAEVPIPTGCSIFPKEIFRRLAALGREALQEHHPLERARRGGHFAAFEQPELFVGEVRDCFRPLR